jgi:hypothetical protein
MSQHDITLDITLELIDIQLDVDHSSPQTPGGTKQVVDEALQEIPNADPLGTRYIIPSVHIIDNPQTSKILDELTQEEVMRLTATALEFLSGQDHPMGPENALLIQDEDGTRRGKRLTLAAHPRFGQNWFLTLRTEPLTILNTEEEIALSWSPEDAVVRYEATGENEITLWSYYPPQQAPDGTIRDSALNLISVKSNGTKDLADATVIHSDSSTPLYEVPRLAATIALPKISLIVGATTHEFETSDFIFSPSPNKITRDISDISGGGPGTEIAYALRGSGSHAGTSVYDYDHGWLFSNGWLSLINPVNPIYTQSLVNYVTLVFDNIHGNRNRFTYTNGAAIPYNVGINNIVQDHLYGDMFIQPSNNATAGGITAALVDPGSYVINNATGWMLVTIDTLLEEAFLHPTADPLGYIGARGNIGTFITSTVRIDSGGPGQVYHFSGNRESSPRTTQVSSAVTTGFAIYRRKFNGY